MGEDIKFTFDDTEAENVRIKVIGIGDAGCSAVNRMIEAGVEGVTFAAVNTGEQALRASHAQIKLPLGTRLTSGRGAVSNPEIGREAALQDTERLIELLGESDMVFVIAGLGGGTGTGAAPIVASLANEIGALSVAVVSKPFSFEGNRRMAVAEQGLAELAETADTVVTIPNERLMDVIERGTSFVEAFRIADDFLLQPVQGISDVITAQGINNRGFADVRTILQGTGYAVMSTAVASGDAAAVEAARGALSNPLLGDAGIEGARGILINITGSPRLGFHEVHDASTLVQKSAHPEAIIIPAVVLDDSMEERVKITLIATGFQGESVEVSKKASDAAAASTAELRPALQHAAESRRSEDDGQSVLEAPGLAPTEEETEYREDDEQQVADDEDAAASPRPGAPGPSDPGDLEVPSFLRRYGGPS